MEPQPTQDILGSKKRNYEFLQLVRDKKYPQALILGKYILKQNPENPSVLRFVEFIQKNAKKLDEMVKEQQEYESAHSSDSSEEEQQQAEGGAEKVEQSDKQQSQKSQDEEEEEEEEEKPQKKPQLTTCTLNSIPHVCPRHHKLIIEAAAEGKV